jgi:hydroxymethylpyrimidine/phosphomethylpyrimidine kinase
VKRVLLIAGSDSSGGAGLTRDAATLALFGVEAACALTAVTAQTHTRLTAMHALPASLVRAQIEAALGSGPIAAVKIGMLASGDIALAVAASLPPRQEVPIVLDPVLASSSGSALLDEEGCRVLREELLGRITLLTPNIPEAARLLGEAPAGSEAELLRQGQRLLALGPAAVLVKGGHGGGSEAVDLLVQPGHPVCSLRAPRAAGTQRGTGCTLSAAIAAGLALGLDLGAACTRAKQHLTERLHSADRQT